MKTRPPSVMESYRKVRRDFVENRTIGGQKRPYEQIERFEKGLSWFMDRYLPGLDNPQNTNGRPLTGVDILPERGQITIPAHEGTKTITAHYSGNSVEGEATATQTTPYNMVSRDVFVAKDKVESLRLHVDALDKGYQMVAYHHSVDRECPEKSYLETKAWIVPYRA